MKAMALIAIAIVFAVYVLPKELILGYGLLLGAIAVAILVNAGILNEKKELRFNPPEPPGPGWLGRFLKKEEGDTTPSGRPPDMASQLKVGVPDDAPRTAR